MGKLPLIRCQYHINPSMGVKFKEQITLIFYHSHLSQNFSNLLAKQLHLLSEDPL